MIGKVFVRALAPYRPVDLSRLPEVGQPAAFGVYLDSSHRANVMRLTRSHFIEAKGAHTLMPHRVWCDEEGRPYLFESYGEAAHAVNQHFRADVIAPYDLMPSHTDLMRTPVPGTVEMGE